MENNFNKLKEAVEEIKSSFTWKEKNPCQGYHIIINQYFIWVFVNEITHKYDVTVDTIINNKIESNVEWESYDNPKEALARFYYFVGKYSIQIV